MTEALVRSYYEEVMELAEIEPAAFGESAEPAESHPQQFAKNKALLYKDVLAAMSMDTLGHLYQEWLTET